MSIAEYYLKLNQFDRALESLAKVKRLDRLYKQQVYAISLKIYYSADQSEAFYSEISSFRSFMRTSSIISDRYKVLDSNFIKLILALQKLKESKKINKKTEVLDLRKEIIKNEYTSEKIWLLESLNELES